MSKPYNPNTQGWPFALVVCAITAGLGFAAYSYHNATYRHPRDPMMQQVYADRDLNGGGHGGEHGDDHGEEHAEGEDHSAEGGADH